MFSDLQCTSQHYVIQRHSNAASVCGWINATELTHSINQNGNNTGLTKVVIIAGLLKCIYIIQVFLWWPPDANDGSEQCCKCCIVSVCPQTEEVNHCSDFWMSVSHMVRPFNPHGLLAELLALLMCGISQRYIYIYMYIIYLLIIVQSVKTSLALRPPVCDILIEISSKKVTALSVSHQKTLCVLYRLNKNKFPSM